MKAPLFLLLIMALFSCKKEAAPALTTSPTTPIATTPIVRTYGATDITLTNAIIPGYITSDGGATVTAKGVCWSTGNNPTIADSKTTDDEPGPDFYSLMSGLTDGTTYNVRAYATNNAGTGYGNVISFSTIDSSILFNADLTYGTVADVEGNVYKTIQIGTQTWMAENLKTSKYANGDLIDLGPPPWESSNSTPTYNLVPIYGRLYTWFVATDTRNVCPTGWHVPSDAEWTTLTTYVGGESGAGDKLKETGTNHWLSSNSGVTNETGFTALPGGYSYYEGGYFLISIEGDWGSSTEYSYDTDQAYFRSIDSYDRHVHRAFSSKQYRFSIRCVKDY